MNQPKTIFPTLSARDIVGAQPMTGSTDLSFKMEFTTKEDDHQFDLIDPYRIFDGKKRNEYRPKPLKFQHTCEGCSSNFASADIKGRFCKDCKAPRLCRCGCGKTVKTPGHWYRSGCRLRGKTYTEIYGNILPACGFKTGDQNIAKTIEIRRKISEGVSKSYTPVLLELRRKHCPFNRTKHESNNNKKRII